MASPSSPQKQETQEKVDKYTQFLDNVLRPELKEAKRLLEETQLEISEYEELRATLQKDLPKTTTVDLGYGAVSCEAKIIDNPMIYVDVGLGFHVEMTVEEALEFTKQRIAFLQANQLENRQKSYNQVQDHAQSAMNILEELAKVQNQMGSTSLG